VRLLLLALALGGCARSSDTSAQGAVPLRVVLIADTHVIGPQYACCSESDGIDNASIMRTPERLEATVARINAIEPPPDHVFVLGDVVHDAHRSHDPAWYDEEDNAFPIARDLLARLDAPTHVLWGNHDYEVDCGGGDTYEREFTEELFARFFDVAPFDVVDDRGWKFVMLNSQRGPTWDPADPLCNTGLGSYGAEQLAWLDEQLAEGVPTFVLSHHHHVGATKSDQNDGPDPDVSAVLARHDNVAAHVAGHLHRWMDLDPTDVNPFRHLILGATRYDDDNFWLLELSEDGAFEIVDYDKPKWLTTCAATWTYDGAPAPDPDGVETGDCGS
jgi:hypothetical protein